LPRPVGVSAVCPSLAGSGDRRKRHAPARRELGQPSAREAHRSDRGGAREREQSLPCAKRRDARPAGEAAVSLPDGVRVKTQVCVSFRGVRHSYWRTTARRPKALGRRTRNLALLRKSSCRRHLGVRSRLAGPPFRWDFKAARRGGPHSKALRAFSWFLGARQPTGMGDCLENAQSKIPLPSTDGLTDRNDSLRRVITQTPTGRTLGSPAGAG
jgi:hypothetical protein